MKAILVDAYGGPGNMRFGETDKPVPGPGEALVKVSMAGLNFIDVYMRSGLYKNSHTYAQKPPMVIGMEGAGSVEALGDGVTQVSVGEQVAWCLHLGSYAEYAVVPAWKLVPVPDDIPVEMATTLMLQGCTAHYMTNSLHPLKAGERALIHAGAGGVGQIMTQLAKAKGAEVITTVGSDEKAEISRSLGADHVIVYTREDFAARVAEITNGEGCHAVYDSVGIATIEGSMKSTARRGTLCNYGASSGAVHSINPLDIAEAGSIFFTRPHLADYIPNMSERRRRADDLFGLYRKGQLRLRLDRTYPLAEAAYAHRALQARETRGKVLLAVS
jgi:NADPH2:quinone reductase